MFLRRTISGLRAAAFACIALAAGLNCAANAQDSAQSNATFWLQERARAEHVRPTPAARQSQRVRRLVPNKRLARPTLWRRPSAHPVDTPQEPTLSTPATAPVPSTTPELATPVPAQPNPSPQTPSAPVSADGTPPEPNAAPSPAATPTQHATAPAASGQGGPKPAIAVIGDNLGYMLAQGLTAAEAEDDASGGLGVEIARKTRDSSGLVRDDFYDWPKNLREILAGPEAYAAIAVMIGSNDRQELHDAAGRYEPLTPRWRELYLERVNSVIAQLKAKGAPFFWVGLPIMRAERYSNDIAQLNDIYRAQVEAAGGRYVDIWDAFSDEKGRYSVFGPDVNGQIVKLRTADGVHFTKAGQRKLAYFVEQAMRGLLDHAKPTPDAAIAALPPTAGPAPTASEPAAGAPGLATPGQVAPVAAPAPPPKPEFGPIVPLTAPPLALNGELLGPADKAGGPDRAHAALAPELASGQTPPAPKGRADDFVWPPR